MSSSEDERREKNCRDLSYDEESHDEESSYEDSDDEGWVEQVMQSQMKVSGVYPRERCVGQLSIRYDTDQMSKSLVMSVCEMHREFQKNSELKLMSYNDSKAIADALNLWPRIPTSETMMVIEPNGTTRCFFMRGFRATYVPWSVFCSTDLLQDRMMMNSQMMLVRWAVSVMVLDLQFYLSEKEIGCETVEGGFRAGKKFYANETIVTVEEGISVLGLVPLVFRPLISLFGMHIVVEAFDSYNLELSRRVMPDDLLVDRLDRGEYDEISYKVMTVSDMEERAGEADPCVMLISQVIRAVTMISKDNLKEFSGVVKFNLASSVRDVTGLNFFLNAEVTEVLKYEDYKPVQSLVRPVVVKKIDSVSQAKVRKDLAKLRASKIQQVFFNF
jgi:hypothetical protein